MFDFFFFKQNTAYEMRISDWSSDVCSSDLRGVTVNVVAPGFIATDMTRDLPEASKEALVQQIALGRLGEPSDIAQAVAFLAGPAASYITGETLHVKGGMYMPCRPRPAARPASHRASRKNREHTPEQNGKPA